LLVDIKIHSAFTDFFPNLCLKADIKKYMDVPYYLGSIHPRFKNYAKAIDNGDCQEGYAILDKNLKVVCDQDLFIKSAKKDDTFYIVPAIVGGGGKRGNMLLLAALAIAAPGIGSMLGSGTFLGGYGAAGASVASTLGMAAPAAGTGMALSIGQSIGINAGLALVTSLFTERPNDIKQTDQNIRSNDMFGSLQNTIDSGVPIPLIYGMHRVTGQLVSGYLDTVDHGKEDIITVGSRFTT
jgi:predicted phage tail protein